MARSMTDEERTEEARMMSTPSEWPLPYLPVKRYGGKDGPECGFIRWGADLRAVPTVYLANSVALAVEHEQGKLRTLAEIPTKQYESFDAIVADGWVVD